MDQPIIMPRLERQMGNMNTQKPPISDGGNNFLASSLVVISSSVLIAVASAGTSVYGLCPDESKLPTDKPPVAFNGENHWPWQLDDNAELVVNVGTLSGTDMVVGQANGAPQRSAAVIGTSYNIGRATTGTYAGYQFLNTALTAAPFFTVVGFPDGTLPTDYNGLVRVKIVPTCLQA